MGEINQILELFNSILENYNLRIIVNDENEYMFNSSEELEQTNSDCNQSFNINKQKQNILKVTEIPKTEDHVYDINRNKYKLVESIYTTSDGIIYRANKDSTCKLYNEGCLTVDLYQKLNNMMNEKATINGVRWPREFLYNDKHEIVGYRMEPINNYDQSSLNDFIETESSQYTEEKLYSICFKLLSIINQLQRYHVIYNHIDFTDILINEDEIEIINVEHYAYDKNINTPLFNIPDLSKPNKLMMYKEQFLQVYNLFNKVMSRTIMNVTQCDLCGRECNETEVNIENDKKICEDCKEIVMVQCDLCYKKVSDKDIIIDGGKKKCSDCIKKERCDVCNGYYSDKELTYDDDQKIKCPTCLKLIYCEECNKLYPEKDITNNRGKKKCKVCLYKLQCSICEELFNKNELTLDVDYTYKCKACLALKKCEMCGKLLNDSDLIKTQEGKVCQSCNDMIPCEICNESYHLGELFDDYGIIKCEKCLSKITCEVCQELFDRSDIIVVDGVNKCRECSNIMLLPCDLCKKEKDMNDLIYVDGIKKCVECKDKIQCGVCKDYYDVHDTMKNMNQIKCKDCYNKVRCERCENLVNRDAITTDPNGKRVCFPCSHLKTCSYCGLEYEQSTEIDSKLCETCHTTVENIYCNQCQKDVQVLKSDRYAPYLKRTKLCKSHFELKYMFTCQKCQKNVIRLNPSDEKLCKACNEKRGLITRLLHAIRSFIDRIATGDKKNKDQ